MSKKAVPDAWEDDWESLADVYKITETEEPKPNKKLSKAERKAQHAELNRKIWESAENPEPLLFLQARNDVPLQSAFKPGVTLLSRKPPPQVLSRSTTSGIAGLTLEDDDDNSEEERRKKKEEYAAERKAKLQREREEKERRYAEVRQRLFGTPTSTSEDNSDRASASPNRQGRGKGKGRGGRESQPRSSNEQSPAESMNSNSRRQLYDPTYSAKPNSVYVQRQESGNNRPSTSKQPSQVIREPRGPEVSGRGGNGFASRGGRNGPAVS
ncbi:hypothetical protein GQ43DRAFT_490571 [Delitschia confertaspora ATCC 74209]|uniref:SUZ domain-containing protein n=1 Tax=Delitschia confertaspora ATCC 74209 TaxID=1513339 RepID=A0A9P4MXI6_9PLEO|nr:hypothetical protein GQ43DRAFT_490571 [Delitschia confertaspora ATCC 74209]